MSASKAVLTVSQINARIRERAAHLRVVPVQVDEHRAAMRAEPVESAPRARLRDDPDRLAAFRARYRASYKANERDRTVYFAKLLETDAVKIGHARNPEKRVRDLFRAYGVVAEIVGTIPGDVYIERHLHFLLRRARVPHGIVPELFDYSIVRPALDALTLLQPDVDQVFELPRPSRTFNSAALDVACIAAAARQMGSPFDRRKG